MRRNRNDRVRIKGVATTHRREILEFECNKFDQTASLNRVARRWMKDSPATLKAEIAGTISRTKNEVPLHYFVADRSGESAVIEFVRNKVEVLYNNNATFQVSTNFILHDALPNLCGHCWRYDLAHATLNGKAGILSMSEGLKLRRGVSQNNTMWSAVYGLATGEIQVVAGRRYDSVFNAKLVVRSR